MAIVTALVVACAGCAASGRARPAEPSSGVGSPSAFPAPSAQVFVRAQPPPAAVPPATLLMGGVKQDGVLFAYTWIVDGRIKTVPPKPPMPWPVAASLPAAGGTVLVSIPVTPHPAWVDVRAYRTLDASGAPREAVTCNIVPNAGCVAAGPDGDPAVRLALSGAGPRMIVVNASWTVPRSMVRAANLPPSTVSVRAAWLFRLTL